MKFYLSDLSTNEWYSCPHNITMKDGTEVKEYVLIFKTTDKSLAKEVETYFKSLMDRGETE